MKTCWRAWMGLAGWALAASVAVGCASQPRTAGAGEGSALPSAAVAEMTAGESAGREVIRVVEPTDAMVAAVVAASPKLEPVLASTLAWKDTPYEWGGKRPIEGMDCSGYTWRAYYDNGLGYEGYMNTHTLARMKGGNGLRKIDGGLAAAKPGDLLVYGYYREPETKGRWRGHVVILIDATGETTGEPGLVVGSHGGTVDRLAFVVAEGFDEGYFREPNMPLVSVLRPVALE
ncbi:MAG: NlpC/P60 family protein [Planctomycetota bacterium]